MPAYRASLEETFVETWKFIRFFEQIGNGDVGTVGGKNASLGEMYRKLTQQGVRIPNGFAVTADAYRYMLDKAGALEPLRQSMTGLDPANVEDLANRGRRARQIIRAYRKLQAQYGEDVSLAVRSSATAEDLPTASFAGQQETYLNIRGDENLLDACRRDFASLFTDRAIHYRVDQGFDHFKVALSIGIMKMVRSDLAASGVIFTLDTESGFRDVVFITGSYGLGENVVQGAVDPDEFYVHKPTFRAGHRTVLRRALGDKAVKMIYVEGEAGRTTRNVPTPKTDRARYCIGDAEALQLAEYAIAIEDHYGRPMDIEWAKDGIDGQIYIVQARPETVASQRRATTIDHYALHGRGEVLIAGKAVGERIAAGEARVIRDLAQLGEFKPGEVLVADITTPDWEPVMKTAAAIVTNRGGRTCHAAIIARELGVPAVVGTGDATGKVANGAQVTVSCAEGDTGKVYGGRIPFGVEHLEVADMPRPATAIMINIGNPEIAFKTSFLPNDGVGLARMEFVISEYIKAHPLALLHPERIRDPGTREAVASLTGGVLAEAGGRAHVGLQVERICDAARRRGFRTGRGQPDARLSRLIPLRASGVRRGIPARMPGDAAGARGDGLYQRDLDAAVRATSPGGRRGAGEDGRVRPATRHERPRDLCDVRDPQQRRVDRPVREALRRLLDRLERPYPVDTRRRSGQRDRRVRLR
jgi:pyruvate,water dikinase